MTTNEIIKRKESYKSGMQVQTTIQGAIYLVGQDSKACTEDFYKIVKQG